MPSYVASRISDVAVQALRETEVAAFGTNHADHPLVVRLRQVVPFDQFAISGIDYVGLSVGKGVFLASNFPVESIKAYFERRLVEKDPLARKLSPETPVVSCHTLSQAEQSTPEAIEVAGFCKLYAIGRRTSFGLYSGERLYGAATFTRQTPFSDTECLVLEAVARQIHAELSRERLLAMNTHLGLSGGEVASLQAMADGLSVEEAARRLGYAAETVQSYLKSLMRKMSASNRAHAIAEAQRRQIIF